MNLNITIVSKAIETVPTAKGSYQKAVVTYKNDQGKVESKNVMSFTNKPVWEAIANANQGDVFSVHSEKNDKGYWEWKSLTKGAAAPQLGTTNASSTVRTGTWETPTERAKKQVYIVRQSSLSNAIDALSPGAKAALKAADVIALAREFEDYVFGEQPSVSDSNKIPVDNMDDDLPF